MLVCKHNVLEFGTRLASKARTIVMEIDRSEFSKLPDTSISSGRIVSMWNIVHRKLIDSLVIYLTSTR